MCVHTEKLYKEFQIIHIFDDGSEYWNERPWKQKDKACRNN